jgi:cytochrome d ubiquinol oxidase subunit II
VSLATPLVSPRIFERWFSMPAMLYLLPLPVVSAALIVFLWRALRRLPRENDRRAWVPFATTISLFTLGFAGMAYSFYPYVVPERLTVFQAASAPESLMIILVGAIVVLPMIVGYTVLSYAVFRGKAREMDYG